MKRNPEGLAEAPDHSVVLTIPIQFEIVKTIKDDLAVRPDGQSIGHWLDNLITGVVEDKEVLGEVRLDLRELTKSLIEV